MKFAVKTENNMCTGTNKYSNDYSNNYNLYYKFYNEPLELFRYLTRQIIKIT